MKTRREALVEAGLAKPGRGKFSAAALAWLEDQRNKGVKFSDDDAPVKRTEAKTEATQPKVQAPDPANSHYLLPDEYRFPEAEYVAKDTKGTVYSLRECCNTCRVSLVNHACNSPTILGSIAVTIVRR